MDLAAGDEAGGDFQVLQAAVGATAEDRLVDGQLTDSGNRLDVIDAVGAGDLGFGDVAAGIDADHAFIDGAGVRGDFVHRGESDLCAHLHGEVGEDHAGGEGHATDGGSVEFHGAVVGSGGAEAADDVEDKILGADPGAELALHLDADGGGHLEPEAAFGPDAGHFGGSDASGEGAESAMGGSVRVGADDNHAGADVTALGEHLVADSSAADVVKVGDALGGDELADGLVSGGGLLALSGDAVVENDNDFGGVPNAGDADLKEALADEVGVFVAHGEIDAGDDDLVGTDGCARRGARENLLGDGHAHGSAPDVSVRRRPWRAGTRARGRGSEAGRQRRCSPGSWRGDGFRRPECRWASRAGR